MVDRIGPKLVNEARRHGAGDVRIHHGGKHPRIVGAIEGESFSYVFAATASDHRAERNALAGLRRTLRSLAPAKPADVSPPARKKLKRRGRAQDAKISLTLKRLEPAPAPKDCFYGPLAALRARLRGVEDGKHGHSGVERGIEAKAKDSAPTKACRGGMTLRTPWLGRRTRWISGPEPEAKRQGPPSHAVFDADAGLGASAPREPASLRTKNEPTRSGISMANVQAKPRS